MSEVEVRPDVDLNELYDQDVPCKRCQRPAVLRSFGHGSCQSDKYPIHSCIGCWQRWLKKQLGILNRHKRIRCEYCDQTFTSVESFSDYRPF